MDTKSPLLFRLIKSCGLFSENVSRKTKEISCKFPCTYFTWLIIAISVNNVPIITCIKLIKQQCLLEEMTARHLPWYVPGYVAQLCLATDASLTADPGVASWMVGWYRLRRSRRTSWRVELSCYMYTSKVKMMNNPPPYLHSKISCKITWIKVSHGFHIIYR